MDLSDDEELRGAAAALADWMMACVEAGDVTVDVVKRRLRYPGQFALLIDKVTRDHRIRYSADEPPPEGVFAIRELLGREPGTDRVPQAVTLAFFLRHRQAFAPSAD